MSTLVTNECGVQTILPMGLVCNVTDASTPTSLNGAVYLTITGGSVPYSVTWSNGSKSQNLYSVSAGTYTATVVDYYGDYSATTTCTVETDQFYVDWFRNCANEYDLYLTGLTDTYTESLIYRLSANTGCFIYSGKTLNGLNTLTFDNILEGPYDTCEECDPPIVLPYYPDMLCLYTQSPYTTYQFEFYGFANGKPTYTGTSLNSLTYTIQWVTGNTNQWQVLNKTGNSLINPNYTFNPLGGWVLQGTQQVWTAVSGACPTIPELTATISSSNLGCENECKGNAVVTASGGVPPYQYSFDGGSSSPLPSKTNLCPGNHTYIVTDSSGNTYNGSFEIIKGPKVTTYSLSLTYVTTKTQTNYGVQVGDRLDYFINVTPPLPDGVEITVPINVSFQKTLYNPGATTVTYTPSFYSGGTTVSPTSNSLTKTNVYSENPYSYRYPYNYTSYTYNVLYNNIKLKKGLVVSGSLITEITKVSDGTPSCSCSSYYIENPSNTTQYYSWTNCTGGTETSYNLSAGQNVSICACSVRKGTPPTYNDGNSLIITRDAGSLNCAGAVTDGKLVAGASFGPSTVSGSCVALRVQTPQPQQLFSQLYQNSGGIGQ